MPSTQQLLDILKNQPDISLPELLTQLPDTTFVSYLGMLMEKYQVRIGPLIRQTVMNRTYVYQIINGTRKPSHDKVIQLALAMGANLNETQHLLALSDNGALYPQVCRDALLTYSIEKKLSVLKANELLLDNRLRVLE